MDKGIKQLEYEIKLYERTYGKAPNHLLVTRKFFDKYLSKRYKSCLYWYDDNEQMFKYKDIWIIIINDVLPIKKLIIG